MELLCYLETFLVPPPAECTNPILLPHKLSANVSGRRGSLLAFALLCLLALALVIIIFPASVTGLPRGGG